MDTFDLVYIEWVDSCTPQPGWKRFEEWSFDVVYCQSVGWIVEQGDDYITLSGTIGRDKGFDSAIEQGECIITIPKSAIKRMLPLVVVDEHN